MIGSQTGVEKAEVNYATQSVKVAFHPEIITAKNLQRSVQSIGYDLIIDHINGKEKQEEAQKNQSNKLKRNITWATVLTIPVVLIGMVFMDMPYANYIMLVLTAPVLFIGGRSFFIGAWKLIYLINLIVFPLII